MTEEKEKVKYVRTTLDLEEKIYIEFKKKCVEERTPMTVVLRNLIIKHINK